MRVVHVVLTTQGRAADYKSYFFEDKLQSLIQAAYQSFTSLCVSQAGIPEKFESSTGLVLWHCGAC
jgi:hypothetical protein